MTAVQMSLPAVTNDATFRTWGQAHKTNLAAMGLVQTADTGQIDWTTALAPTSYPFNRGYEIWRFADALQATKPVFIKIYYGSGSNGAAYMRTVWQVGFSTDGAGNLNSANVSDLFLCDSGYGNTADTWCLMSGDTNRLGYARYVNNNNTNAQSGFHIERSKDSTGADTGDGVAMLRHSGWNSSPTINSTGGMQDHYMPFSGPVPAKNYYGCYALCAPGSSSIFGLDVGVFPHFPFKGKFFPPKMNLLSYQNTDFTQNLPISITHYGSAKTFIPLGTGSAYPSGQQAPAAYGQGYGSTCLMMRYE